jgi:hypothetical protein
MIERWAGNNPRGLSRLKVANALNIYGDFFSRESVIRATCEYYAAGAGEDVELQAEDQRNGKKFRVPLLLLYGADYIGKRFDVGKSWEDWVGNGIEVTDDGLPDGIGHFGSEEAPDETTEALLLWVKSLLQIVWFYSKASPGLMRTRCSRTSKDSIGADLRRTCCRRKVVDTSASATSISII